MSILPQTVSVTNEVLHGVGEAAGLLDRVASRMASLAWPNHQVFHVRLALEEALINAILHGNGGDPNKTVRVCWAVRPDEVEAAIEDEGPGFDPESVPDPRESENLGRSGGRGLLLLRACMTTVYYSATGNRVTLHKRRSHA
jgi:serine/threonine-protein kinase RsbW